MPVHDDFTIIEKIDKKTIYIPEVRINVHSPICYPANSVSVLLHIRHGWNHWLRDIWWEWVYSVHQRWGDSVDPERKRWATSGFLALKMILLPKDSFKIVSHRALPLFRALHFQFLFQFPWLSDSRAWDFWHQSKDESWDRFVVQLPWDVRLPRCCHSDTDIPRTTNTKPQGNWTTKWSQLSCNSDVRGASLRNRLVMAPEIENEALEKRISMPA